MLYHCQKCDTHLKVWPCAKLRSMDCAECFVKIENNGENIHLCFICDKMLCPKHKNSDSEERIHIDWSKPETVPLPDLGDGGISESSDSHGFPDLQEGSPVSNRTPFNPSLPAESPGSEPSLPSVPPPSYIRSYISGHNLQIPPNTDPTIRPYVFDPQPLQSIRNPYTPDDSSNQINLYNLSQNPDGDVFPDLPPSYEVAMMDETDLP